MAEPAMPERRSETGPEPPTVERSSKVDDDYGEPTLADLIEVEDTGRGCEFTDLGNGVTMWNCGGGRRRRPEPPPVMRGREVELLIERLPERLRKPAKPPGRRAM
jgi:hypothetical protein